MVFCSSQLGTAALWQSASVDLAATTDRNRCRADFGLNEPFLYLSQNTRRVQNFAMRLIQKMERRRSRSVLAFLQANFVLLLQTLRE